MITRIEAYNYRCFRHLDIELSGFRMLAGTNGAGKTTLLDIPALLGDLVRVGEVGPVFFERQGAALAPRAQGPKSLIYRYRGSTFDLAVEASLPQDVQQALVNEVPDLARTPERIPNALRYELRFVVFNERELQIDAEYLILFNASSGRRQGRPSRAEKGALAGERSPIGRGYDLVIERASGQASLIRPFRPGVENAPEFVFDLPSHQLALANVPADRRLFPAVRWFRSLLRDGVRVYEPSPGRLRLGSSPGQGGTLQSDAGNLPWLLLDMEAGDTAEWLAHAQLALPPLRNVVPYVREGDGHASFRVEFDGGLIVEAAGLSEGTLRILALTAIPFLPRSPEVLIIEQPEDGLHPRAIEAVLGALDLRLDAQVWSSTHSPVALAHTDLDSIVIVRPGADGATAVSGSVHPNLAAWKGALNPGELYAAGILS